MKQRTSENTQNIIRKNIADIRLRIKNACNQNGRNPEEVRLMLVTKTVPTEKIVVAMEDGEHLLGVNTIDGLIQVKEEIKAHHPEIHFIGNLRESDLDTVLAYADCIQSVDNMESAREINRRLEKLDKKIDVLIQVNTSRRDSPYGIIPAHVIGLVLQVSKLEHLCIRGLMTLGVFGASQEKAQSCFRLLKNLYEEIVFLDIPGIHVNTLSMGMSSHLETAIAEGATMVRVGTAIFGDRDTPDSYYWKE
ncbi:YggS family pyridoxal phosphate-dependent enzyme [Membranicola marinus]|uniref:Pyridoxal phosphate homeostasis protein n=1 Tax=Membranihabitans marinus TaxID=1227546 RepID=A0A953HLY7_9BACT|nr:YggS family pyridoxal phosphate-dependent enzyme [Membranihabitans marinus]MBY5958404.1 YggS family pyridoxal phosphate-dependent enzyme [Membranihabitans marinus]